MATELKPCPYCGSSNVEMMRYHDLFGVECRDCWQPSWRYYTTIKTAVEQWNRRKVAYDIFQRAVQHQYMPNDR